MTTSNSILNRRLDKIAGPASPYDEHPEMAAALLTLRISTVALCGHDREQWLQRVARGRATAADNEVLGQLPADALDVADMTGIEYVGLMHRVLTDF